MHHHLFSSEDTYITNRSEYGDKNFGIDELLQIGTDGETVKSKKYTKTFTYSGVAWDFYCVTDFTGIFAGTFDGGVTNSTGSITGSFVGSASYFNGNMTGSYDGYLNGAAASNAAYGGPLAGFSGSLSASAIVGKLTGSLIVDSMAVFSGSLTGSSGHLTGVVFGTDTVNNIHWEVEATKFADRTLIKFDLSSISASIVNGSITNPLFKLNLKVCNEYELPIEYSIYAFPVSQSWEMGNGYFADGGSDTGTSWYYKDYASGSLWTEPVTMSVHPVVDFFNTESNSSKSFNYGGGTWYYASSSKQDFVYESADICMDVTDIVLAWLSGSLPNNGFILMSSDEIVSSGSGFALTFFGKDTNSINSPYLDVMWDDWVGITGSLSTGSVIITSSFSGMTVTVQSGSTFSIAGGISGSFTSSVFLRTYEHYITSSGDFINQSVQKFTGSFSGSFNDRAEYVSGSLSGSGWFTSSYWSGSINGVNYEYNNSTGVSSSLVNGILSGSINTTGSIGVFVGRITSSLITLNGVITGSYLDTSNLFLGGLVIGGGTKGNITGLPVVGEVSGIQSINMTTVTGPCGKTFDTYLVSASFLNGVFSGSTFTAYYIDGVFENVFLTGSWTGAALLGANVSIPIPSGIDPYAYAYVTGVYVTGKALGTYVTTRSIADSERVPWDSASFSGQFISGPLFGGYLNVQLSGSIYTSSYAYTSSVAMTSTVLSPLTTDRPFVVIVKNLNPAYKGGDVSRINIFARKEFPLKTFGKATQQAEYLVPEYLPTSSYYAIKDNMSEEIIVDFDNYTRISCDTKGNYFLLDTTGFAQERPYRVLIRVNTDNSIYTFDNGNVFKITR